MSAATLLLGWADDLYLHGHQLARWIVDYVDLEESLASGSAAQQDLEHAAALIQLAGCSVDERAWRIYQRPIDEWWPSRLTAWSVETWPVTVARALALNAGVVVLLDALGGAQNGQVAETAQVARAEQELHARHWGRWVRILNADVATRDEFVDSLTAAFTRAVDLFGDVESASQSEPVLDVALDLEALHATWTDQMTSLLAAEGVWGVTVPDERVSRSPGGDPAELEPILETVRSVTANTSQRSYEVYR